VRRILIIGSGGTGKSVCARRLGDILNLPVFHLDCYFWQPNWQKTPHDEWLDSLTTLLHKPKWIIDGNYSSTMSLRFKFADTVIYLDYPTRIALIRAFKRQAFNKRHPRSDITPGCRERLSGKFLLFIWRFHKQRRPQILKMFSDPEFSHLSINRFNHPKELEFWLKSLQEKSNK